MEEGKICNIKTKKTETFGDIEISSDFECGSCSGITKVDKNVFFIKIFSDPSKNPKLEKILEGYNWYFCMKVSDKVDSPKKIVLFAGTKPTGTEEEFNKSSAPFFVSTDFVEWSPLSNVWENNSGIYRVELELKTNEIYYISNSIPRPYSMISNWLREVVSKNGDICHLRSIGKSVQGRDIFLLSITENSNENKKDRIIVTSGFHPAEPDTFATEAIIEFLISDEILAQEIRKKFIVDIIPQMNPDGFVLGTNGCNAKGVNLYWNFCCQDRENCPEAYYLWQFIKKNIPFLYIDYHCYVHQYFKEASPYLKSLFYYNGSSVRGLVKQMDKYLLNLCQNNATRGWLTDFPSTLSYLITKEFNTIAYTKFHLHLKHGIERSKKLGLEVFKGLVNICIENEMCQASKIFKEPYGMVKKETLYEVYRRINQLNYCYGIHKVTRYIGELLRIRKSLFQKVRQSLFRHGN